MESRDNREGQEESQESGGRRRLQDLDLDLEPALLAPLETLIPMERELMHVLGIQSVLIRLIARP